jgi:hypothetical protein
MNAPTPTVLARNLRQLADRLDDEGDRAVRRAPILAARGWPTSTNGNEGGRSSDPTSSTERAALNPDPRFDDIDGRLREHMRLCWYMAVRIHANLDVILSHAPDDDYVKPGTGVCDRCGLICTNKTRALKLEGTGLCHACDEGLRRYRRKYPNTTRSDYLTATAGAAAYENVRRRVERDTA